MKTLSQALSQMILPVLIPALTCGATAYASSLTPVVTVEKQILTHSPILFQPLHFKDAKTGEELMLAQHRLRGFGAFINVSLYDTKGNVLLTRRLADQKNLGDYSWISHARFDSSGNLIILQTLSDSKAKGENAIWSHNLTLGTSVKLIDGVESVRILDRVVEPTRSLVGLVKAVKVYNSLFDKIEVVDESTGAVVRSVGIAQMESANFGSGRNGLAKVIVSGWEPSVWKTIDVASGASTPIQISEDESRNRLSEQTTVLGVHFQLQSETTLSLLDQASLFDGKIVRVRTMPRETQFFGSSPQELAMERTESTLVVRDLKTGLQIGKTLPVNPAFPSRKDDDFQMRGRGLVEDILLTPMNKIVVIHEAIVPNSYMPGSVLSYMDIETGKLLRRQRLKLYTLRSRLVETEQGRAIAVELDPYRSSSPKNLNRVIDIRSNEILREIVEGEKFFTVMKSATGRAIQAKADDRGQMCFADLLIPESAQTCVALPMGAYTGWFSHTEKTSAFSTTFRSGVLDSQNDLRTERGWVEFSVR